jgi:hypothetical protein
VALVVLGLLAASTAAAFAFGKNKPSYKRFDWRVYKSPHFDIHYYPESEPLLDAVVSEAESAYLELSQRLEHEISQRIPLLIYRTHSEFRQTNVSLREIPQGAGAFAEPFQKRMVLPIDDPPDKRYKLIRHELVHVFQFDILYGESLRRIVRSSPPLWLTEGMASYLADDEDSFDQMIIRDAVVNNLVPSLRQLSGFSFLTYRYGNAVYSFIEQEYGAEGIRTFLFEYRKSLIVRDVSKAFSDAFGLTVDQFDRRFARYLRQRYLPILTSKRSPEEYGTEVGLSKPGRFTFSPVLSPSGDLIAALATPGLELDVVILSARDGDVIRNVTKGFTTKYESVATSAFEGKRDLSWSPGGDAIAFFVERENLRDLLVYDPVSGRRLERIELSEISEPTSPAFSPDGKWIAFSGNRDGFWDIFRINLETREIENLTRDSYFDSNPSWSEDGRQLLYNRRIGSFEKIFSVGVDSPERKTQLTAGASSDIQPMLSRDGKWIYFSSDRGLYGVFNLHRLELATGRIERLTDLVGGAFSPVDLGPAEDGAPQIVFTAYFAGTFRVYRMKVGGDEVNRAREIGAEEPPTSPLAPSRRDGGPPADRPEERLEGAEPAPRADSDAVTIYPERRVGGRWLERPRVAVLPASFGYRASADDAAAEEADADLEPFRPPLELGIDEDRKTEYKPKWNLTSPQIAVGLTDDGRFLSDISLEFTDVVGDRRIFVNSASVDNFSAIQGTYLNVAARLDWGARLSDARDFFRVVDTIGRIAEGQNRYTAVDVFAQYPLNRYYRLEGSAGYAQQRNDFPFAAPTGEIVFASFDYDYPFASLAIAGDTTRFQSFGPFQGRRFRAEVTGYEIVSGDLKGESVVRTSLDFRFYQHMTRRSLIAFRAAGILQTGATASTYSIGGVNQLRGYDYRQFFGDNIAWANLEIRIPLIDAINWSFGLPMGPVRGFLFADAGTAWFREAAFLDDEGNIAIGKAVFDPTAPGGYREYQTRGDDGLLRDLKVSAGVGLEVNFLGLPLNWTWARRWDGEEFGTSRSDFYIVYNW